MRRAFATYTSKLEGYGRDSIGLIFYAGHGLQVNGQNYIMPIDARIVKEADVAVEALNASTLMRSITLLGNKLNIIILDACRNNPYRAVFRSASRGLARMDAPIGSLVAFSTAPGMVAADGTGANSPYSESLARAITTPGLKIEDMFKRVRNDVFKETKGSQVPWEIVINLHRLLFCKIRNAETENTVDHCASQSRRPSMGDNSIDYQCRRAGVIHFPVPDERIRCVRKGQIERVAAQDHQFVREF